MDEAARRAIAERIYDDTGPDTFVMAISERIRKCLADVGSAADMAEVFHDIAKERGGKEHEVACIMNVQVHQFLDRVLEATKECLTTEHQPVKIPEPVGAVLN